MRTADEIHGLAMWHAPAVSDAAAAARLRRARH